MADKYRMTGSVDPNNRIDRIEYAKDKALELGGEPQTLSPAQVEKVSAFVVLERVDPDAGVKAEFGGDEAPPPAEESPAEEPVQETSTISPRGAGARG